MGGIEVPITGGGKSLRSVMVGLTYVGAVVGAGFASGQEIYLFFSRYGKAGSLGVVLAGILFFALGWLALERGRVIPVRDRFSVQGLYRSRFWSDVAQGMVLGFLVVGLGVVVAGGGAALHEVTGMPAGWGALGSLGLMLGVVWLGPKMVVWVNAVLVPYLVVLAALVSWRYVPRGTLSKPVVAIHGHWILSALLYVSYNLFTAILVLLGLGRSLTSSRQTGLAALVGAALLTAMALLEHRVLMALATIGTLPLLEAAKAVHPVMGALYGISLWAALFTTGVAEAFAFTERMGLRRLWWLIAAYPLSTLGFEGLISTLYPVMGLLAIFIWVPLLRSSNRTHG